MNQQPFSERVKAMPPLTLEQAKTLQLGTYLYARYGCNAAGEPYRWKVSGQVKTWKRDADRIRVPIKRGLYAHSFIDLSNVGMFSLTDGASHARI